MWQTGRKVKEGKNQAFPYKGAGIMSLDVTFQGKTSQVTFWCRCSAWQKPWWIQKPRGEIQLAASFDKHHSCFLVLSVPVKTGKSKLGSGAVCLTAEDGAHTQLEGAEQHGKPNAWVSYLTAAKELVLTANRITLLSLLDHTH